MLCKAPYQLAPTLDGRQAAPKTVSRKRVGLYNALEYAVELKLLSSEPPRRSQVGDSSAT